MKINLYWLAGFLVSIGTMVFAWGRTAGILKTRVDDNTNRIEENEEGIKKLFKMFDEHSQKILQELAVIKTDIKWLKKNNNHKE